MWGPGPTIHKGEPALCGGWHVPAVVKVPPFVALAASVALEIPIPPVNLSAPVIVLVDAVSLLNVNAPDTVKLVNVPNDVMYPECGCGGYEPSVEDYCKNPLDKEYALPGYLQNQVLALTSQKLLSTYFRINDDKTSDNKDDQVSPK